MNQLSGEVQKKSEQPEILIKARSSKDEDEKMADVLKKFFERQSKSVIPKMGAKAAKWWDKKRWDKELADDLEGEMDEIADAHGESTADLIGQPYDTDRTRKYIRTVAEARAGIINESTYKKLVDRGDSEPSDIFKKRLVDAAVIGGTLALASAAFGTRESIQQARDNGYQRQVFKRWVTGDNPRPSHAMMNGEEVPIDEPFSNGMMWPGDDNADADETCGCNCSTEIIVR